MSEEIVWTDTYREEIRQIVRKEIMGRIRLANCLPEQILEFSLDYIDDMCPEQEKESFRRFATEQLQLALRQYEAEKADWPKTTDCDRMDHVEQILIDRGILLWQASPCCDTCTMAELEDRLNVVDERNDGFRSRLRGYAFFIDQSMPDSLGEGTEISVYLGYGWLSSDGLDVDPDQYEQRALAIAHEVCQCLRDEGFEPNWDGSFNKKIGLKINWLRREPLD